MKVSLRRALGLFSFFTLSLVGAACGSGDELSIRSVDPQSGRLQGDERVTIRGNNFRTDLSYTVYFGPNRSRRVAVQDAKTLVAFTPRGNTAGPVDIAVRGDDGVTLMIHGGYVYEGGDSQQAAPRATAHEGAGAETGSSLVY